MNVHFTLAIGVVVSWFLLTFHISVGGGGIWRLANKYNIMSEFIMVLCHDLNNSIIEHKRGINTLIPTKETNDSFLNIGD